ncbi:MAG: dihydroorotate dehydrogenase electron transfer subunit [Thermoanaerobaculia bacterium]
MRADHRAVLLRNFAFSPGLFSVSFHAPQLARAIGPGQFVMLEVPGLIRPYLRRPYSVADADAEKGEVEFLVKTIGRGTEVLEKLSQGSPVNLLGPLGKRFSFEGLKSGQRAAVVAGGIGAAPFPLLFRALAQAGVAGDFYLGGRTETELSLRSRFEGVVRGQTILATDDGSLGERGFVTQIFERRAVAGGPYVAVFACGPMPMLAALARVVSRLNLPAEFSTEAEMGCGFGVCLGCVIPGTEKPFLISCQEGPILPPEKIRW